MTETGHWSVSVNRDGENIVTIESNCLSGRDLSAEDEDTIRLAARSLLAFVGARMVELAGSTPRGFTPSEKGKALGSAPDSSSSAPPKAGER